MFMGLKNVDIQRISADRAGYEARVPLEAESYGMTGKRIDVNLNKMFRSFAGVPCQKGSIKSIH